MFVPHIVHCGIPIPSDPDQYNKAEYPHWHVFICLHIGLPTSISTMQENARIIASLSAEEITSFTYEQLADIGVDLNPVRSIVLEY